MSDIDNILKKVFDDTVSNEWKPSEHILVIEDEIEKLHLDLKTFLEDGDHDLPSILKESEELRDATKQLAEEMESCQIEIEEETMAEILKSIEKHDQIIGELDRISFVLNIVFDITNCNKLVKDFEECKKTQSFSQAVEAIRDLLQILENPSDGFSSLTMYHNIKTTADMIWENLLQDLQNQFDQIVNYSNKPNGKKSDIVVTLNIENNELTLDVLKAMSICKLLQSKVADFTNFFFTQILLPIMNNECSVCLESEEQVSICLYNNNRKSSYDTVIANMRALLHFVNSKFSLQYGGPTMMSMFSEQIREDFRDAFIRDCLIDTVPNNMSDLQIYGQITCEIENFQHFLTLVNFFPKNNKISILDYLQKIDVIFAEKSSQHYLETARTIMMKDLSLSMSIGVETVPNEEESAEERVLTDYEDALSVLDKTIPKSLFYFPRCMISRSTQELLDLIHVMMEQAVQCSDMVTKKLYVACRLLFELYEAVVPYHHENFLQTIPQYVALFHNNCMYLAHNLLTFGDKWQSQLEGRDVDCPVCFLDLVERLRDLGYKHLTIHMQQQRKQILDNIRSSDLNSIAIKDELGDNAEQAVRQCLRQLQLLKNVWIGVFPANIFLRLMSTLVEMFADEIIHRVCCVEDISAEMAVQLADIYGIVVKKSPSLFQEANHIEKHVSSWVKLQELILVLGGSLKDIEHRWGDGSGPLAVHFRTEEIRNLIKALFQNTQFRANLLTKIK